MNLKQALKQAGKTQLQWAKEQNMSHITASRLSSKGAIVVDGRVYIPTKYTVESTCNNQEDS